VERCLAAGEGDAESQSAVRLAVLSRLAAHHGRHSEASVLAVEAVEAVDRAERRKQANLEARMCANLAAVRRAGGDEAGADAAARRARELFESVGNVAGAAMLREAVGARA